MLYADTNAPGGKKKLIMQERKGHTIGVMSDAGKGPSGSGRAGSGGGGTGCP